MNKIVLNNEDMDKVLNFRKSARDKKVEENKKKVRNLDNDDFYKTFLKFSLELELEKYLKPKKYFNDGLIVLEQSSIEIYFKHRGDKLELVATMIPHILNDFSNKMMAGTIIDLKSDDISNDLKTYHLLAKKYNKKPLRITGSNKLGVLMEANNSIMEIYKSLFFYIEHNTNTLVSKRGKSKKRSKNKFYRLKPKEDTNIDLLTKRLYKENEELEVDKAIRDYNRQAARWTRRGHYREYRDKQGKVTKRVWIEPTVCEARGSGLDSGSDELNRVYHI